MQMSGFGIEAILPAGTEVKVLVLSNQNYTTVEIDKIALVGDLKIEGCVLSVSANDSTRLDLNDFEVCEPVLRQIEESGCSAMSAKNAPAQIFDEEDGGEIFNPWLMDLPDLTPFSLMGRE